jgi:hypothetical protein
MGSSIYWFFLPDLVCHKCQAKFKRRGNLTHHLNNHALKETYRQGRSLTKSEQKRKQQESLKNFRRVVPIRLCALRYDARTFTGVRCRSKIKSRTNAAELMNDRVKQHSTETVVTSLRLQARKKRLETAPAVGSPSDHKQNTPFPLLQDDEEEQEDVWSDKSLERQLLISRTWKPTSSSDVMMSKPVT